MAGEEVRASTVGALTMPTGVSTLTFVYPRRHIYRKGDNVSFAPAIDTGRGTHGDAVVFASRTVR